MKTITVNVTSEDILRGIRNNCHFCPIALALKRKLKNQDAWVGPTEFFLGHSYDQYIDIPNICINFMSTFDEGKYVDPFSFTIEV